MNDLLGLAWEALFLGEAPYAKMREGTRQVARGLALVALVAVAVALLGLIGTTFEWATTPKMSAVKEVVREGLQGMSWYQELKGNPDAVKGFNRGYDLGWRVFPALFGAPNVGTAALRIVLLPLKLALGWLVFGLLGYLFARLFGGEGSVAQTLGCTALAVAPQMLNLISVIPYVTVGGVVGTWVLLCRYVALKTCHRLNWGRALAATLLPYVVIGILLIGLGTLGGVVFGALVGGMGT